MNRVLHPRQAEILRSMSVGRRLRLTASLWEHAWTLKRATLQTSHPDWSEEEVDHAVMEVIRRGRK